LAVHDAAIELAEINTETITPTRGLCEGVLALNALLAKGARHGIVAAALIASKSSRSALVKSAPSSILSKIFGYEADCHHYPGMPGCAIVMN
jgi:hypothetical protein